MDQIAEFEKLWLNFEDLSKKMYKKYIDKNIDKGVTMSDIIKKLAEKRISPYKENEDFLRYCKDVRNDWRHEILERKYMSYNKSLFEDFQDCINLIEKPRSVYSKSIHDIAKFEINEHIIKALKIMRDKDYTNIPITENWILKGMLCESSIIKYLADEEGVLFDNTLKFSDFPELINLEHSRNNILFKKRNERYDAVVSEFIDRYDNGKGEKISCILVTENGKEHEKILWILTPRDIIWKE